MKNTYGTVHNRSIKVFFYGHTHVRTSNQEKEHNNIGFSITRFEDRIEIESVGMRSSTYDLDCEEMRFT